MKLPSRPLLVAGLLTFAAFGCAVEADDDVGDEKNVTNIASADSVAGISEVDGVDVTDPAAAASRFAAASTKPCRTRSIDANDAKVVHVTLTACNDRFDRRVLTGHLTVSFSSNADGTLHVESVSDDLTIDGRPFRRAARADVRADGARRIVTRHVEQSGTKKNGAAVTQTKDVTVEIDAATRCRAEKGTAHAVLQGRTIDSTIEIRTCETDSGEDLCPSGRIEHHHSDGKDVVITFDGSPTADVSIDNGRRPKERSWSLACAAK